jgi:hypothetical protein
VPRDRWLDLLRGGSIVAVVVGHWLVADLVYGSGELRLRSSLGEAPQLWPLTWLFQVIPVFFFVAGAVNGPSWQRASDSGSGYASFVDRRVHRVWVPTAVMLVAVGTVVALLELVAGGGVRSAGAMLMQPLWFLAVYLWLVAATPWTWRLYRRFGGWAFLVLLAVAVAADIGRVGLDIPAAGYVNVVVIWLIVYLVGHAFARGALRPAVARAMLAGGLAALVVATAGPYPARMVGVPGDRLSNMNPPTLAVLALGVAQIGALVLLRPWLSRWLEGRRPWAAVVWLNLSIMTLYLWHQFAMVLATRLLLAAGVPQPPTGAPGWWAMRLVWVVTAGLLLVGLVRLLGRFERVRTPRPTTAAAWSVLGAVSVVVMLGVGLLALAGTRVTEPLLPQHPIGIAVSPLVAGAVVLLTGTVAVANRRSARRLAASLLLTALVLCALGVGYASSAIVGGDAVGLTTFGLAVVALAAAALAAGLGRRDRPGGGDVEPRDGLVGDPLTG